ncbi:MAG: L,D-transpeptidase [Verrucomicrobia bacterium]|nr:L,D-transpeptidase [Verrucomicrobiota bacterium]
MTALAGLTFAAASSPAAIVVFDSPQGPPQTPAEFYTAAANGDAARLDEYLRAGVNANAPLPSPPPAPLSDAINPRNLAGLLLRQGGATPLMFAVTSRQSAAIAALLAAGANREAATRAGWRPLDIAAAQNDIAGMQQILGVQPGSDAAALRIDVSLAEQRATLSRAGITVLTTEISSGRPDKPTPPGTYVVTQKYKDWRSTLYHNASMPWFLRLSCGAVGLHAGYLPGHAASHGCMRLPPIMAKRFYDLTPLGTVVVIR